MRARSCGRPGVAHLSRGGTPPVAGARVPCTDLDSALVPLRDLVRDVMPFLGAMVVVLALITVVPDLVLYLPRLMGYTG